MFPKEFLEVRKVKGKIYPRFAGEKEYPLAEKVIKTFIDGKGRKYAYVLSALKSIENARNYRKVRAFAKVMERFCRREMDAPVDPVKLRLFLFERGYVTEKRERQKIVEYASRHFSTTPDQIEKAMYADMDEEQVLAEVEEPDPERLIKLYNLSLLQTALFNTLRLTFHTSSNHQKIFRYIKWLNLMYELYEEDGLLIEITGPASILKNTRKYGTSMAKLIPSILRSDKWWIRAEILDDYRIYHLEIDDSKKDLFPEYDERVEYDSNLELDFEKKIRVIKPDAKIIREPDVLKAGRYAFIPDFLIEWNRKRVYVEIAGFWTEEYLKKKVEKIRMTDAPLIVIANEKFGEVNLDNVILFSRKIPYNRVMDMLNMYLKLDVDELKFEGDVINLKELFNRYNTSLDEIVERLPKDYVLAGGYALKRGILERIHEEVDRVNPEKLSDVIPILRKFGVGHGILRAIGYEIIWRGINEDEAVVKRIKD